MKIVWAMAFNTNERREREKNSYIERYSVCVLTFFLICCFYACLFVCLFVFLFFSHFGCLLCICSTFLLLLYLFPFFLSVLNCACWNICIPNCFQAGFVNASIKCSRIWSFCHYKREKRYALTNGEGDRKQSVWICVSYT